MGKRIRVANRVEVAFFRMYFQEHGNPIAEEDLLRCVIEVGLGREKTKELLDSNLYENEVREALNFAHQNDIHSLPTYMFNNKYLILDGQPKDTFIRTLKEVSNELA